MMMDFKRCKTGSLLFVLLCGASIPADAEVIILKSGRQLEGPIVNQNSDHITVAASKSFQTVIPQGDIEKILPDGAEVIWIEENSVEESTSRRPLPVPEPVEFSREDRIAYGKVRVIKQELDIYWETYAAVLEQIYSARDRKVVVDVLTEGVRYVQHLQEKARELPVSSSTERLKSLLEKYLEQLIRQQKAMLHFFTAGKELFDGEIREDGKDLEWWKDQFEKEFLLLSQE